MTSFSTNFGQPTKMARESATTSDAMPAQKPRAHGSAHGAETPRGTASTELTTGSDGAREGGRYADPNGGANAPDGAQTEAGWHRSRTSSSFVIRTTPSQSIPHGAAQSDFWHSSLNLNSSSSLAVSADTCWAGANSGANLCACRPTRICRRLRMAQLMGHKALAYRRRCVQLDGQLPR